MRSMTGEGRGRVARLPSPGLLSLATLSREGRGLK
jgi:hypothetical protein